MNFIITWVLARAKRGHVLLRIDDLDKARCRDEYLTDIFRTLDWLGLDYDAGPSGVQDFKLNWSQHVRMDLYQEALMQLRAQKRLFACRCSRKEIRAINADGHYPGTCLTAGLDLNQPDLAWRIHPPDRGVVMQVRQWPQQVQSVTLDGIDAFVVKQKNGFPA